jgi:hypothetical protein
MIPKNTFALHLVSILIAASRAGGQEGLIGYLQTQAMLNPSPFLGLLGKVLPLQIAGDPDNPIKTVTEIRVSFVRPKDRTSGK